MLKMYLLMALVLSGCSTNTKKGDPFKPAEKKSNQALLYIYRAENDWGTARSPTISVDGKNEFDSLHRGYRFFYLDKGEHLVQVKGGDMPSPKVRFVAQPNEVYYLRYDIKGNKSAAGMSFGLLGALLESAMTSSQPDEEKKSSLQVGVALDGFNPNLYFVKSEYALKELSATSLVVDKSVAKK
jgi:hypothetical protein